MNNKTAIIGYGSQGRAWALNLKDSGRDVIIGLPENDPSRKTAENDGIENITTVTNAVKQSTIIVFAFPDHLHGKIFIDEIKPNLEPNCTLVFLHGFSIHFKTIIPPDNCNIILLAPLGPGAAVREKYLAGDSIGFFYNIHHDAAGNAQKVLRNLIEDLRIDRSAMVETTFADEAIGDLFGEQAVLCGGLTQLIKYGFETLVENGLSPDKAYLEVAYQLDLIIDLIKKHGIEGMYNRISVAARYGSYLSGPKIIDDNVKKNMERTLEEIKSGRFAEKLNSLSHTDIENLSKDIKKMTLPAFEKSAGKFSPDNK